MYQKLQCFLIFALRQRCHTFQFFDMRIIKFPLWFDDIVPFRHVRFVSCDAILQFEFLELKQLHFSFQTLQLTFLSVNFYTYMSTTCCLKKRECTFIQILI